MLLNDNLRITYDVNTIRLDNLVALQKTKVDLIKLDVEMHEPEALQGMGLIIERDRPILIIEILNTQIAKEVLAKFSNIDYLSFSISEESFELKYLNEDWSQFGGNFLFLPKEKASSLPRCFLTNGLR